MDYLLIIAHGSRRAESALEIEALARFVAGHPANGFDATAWGFLELAEPSIGQAIDQCVAQGASRISVLPYFLTVGNHVVSDIPEILVDKQQQYPDVEIVQRDYIGKASGMRELVIESLLDGATGSD